jgi:hypothetical protein
VDITQSAGNATCRNDHILDSDVLVEVSKVWSGSA